MEIQEDGDESCQLSSDGGFVIVRIPVTTPGEPGEKVTGILRYSVGSFVGREKRWPFEEGMGTNLQFRIPVEAFRSGEPVTLTVIVPDKAGFGLLWARRYEAGWRARRPLLVLLAQG